MATPFAEPDVFGAPGLPGRSFRDMIIDAREETALIERIGRGAGAVSLPGSTG